MKKKDNLYTIFGSSGFFGSNLHKSLKEKKKKIFIPKKNEYSFKKNLGNVIYCIGTSESIKDPKNALTANLEILSKILINNKFKTFTYLSSIRVYSKSSKTKESDKIIFNYNEKGVYFKSLKLAAESLCLQMNNPKIKIIRLANVFGDYFSDQIYLLPSLLRQSITKKKIDITINKSSRKNYIHINEAIDVILKIINRSKYQIYNVASDKQISLGQISKIIQKLTNCKITYKNSNIVFNEPKINIQRIKKEFDFKPKVKFENEMHKIIKNYKRPKHA